MSIFARGRNKKTGEMIQYKLRASPQISRILMLRRLGVKFTGFSVFVKGGEGKVRTKFVKANVGKNGLRFYSKHFAVALLIEKEMRKVRDQKNAEIVKQNKKIFKETQGSGPFIKKYSLTELMMEQGMIA